MPDYCISLMQVDELTNEFDARRSTGYLCAATAGTFEQVKNLRLNSTSHRMSVNESNLTYSQILDATLDGSRRPLGLSRISVKLNGTQLPTYALNDILVSHPCPASVSRFSFRYSLFYFPSQLKFRFECDQFSLELSSHISGKEATQERYQI